MAAGPLWPSVPSPPTSRTHAHLGAWGSWRGAEQGPQGVVSWRAARKPPALSSEGPLAQGFGTVITEELSCVHRGLCPQLRATPGMPTHNLVPLGAGEEGVLVVTPKEPVGCGSTEVQPLQQHTPGRACGGRTRTASSHAQENSHRPASSIDSNWSLSFSRGRGHRRFFRQHRNPTHNGQVGGGGFHVSPRP